MKAVNILNFAPTEVKNNGDRREFAVCAYEGIKRAKHDSKAYDKDSDVNVGDRHISIKASKFTLMSGTLCEGNTTFDGIWNLYASKKHSNEWCYMTEDFTAYYMNLDEFKEFVYRFCRVEKDSQKNGGHHKIRCREETQEMLRWLEARA
jgi:hypothetical protein